MQKLRPFLLSPAQPFAVIGLFEVCKLEVFAGDWCGGSAEMQVERCLFLVGTRGRNFVRLRAGSLKRLVRAAGKLESSTKVTRSTLS